MQGTRNGVKMIMILLILINFLSSLIILLEASTAREDLRSLSDTIREWHRYNQCHYKEGHPELSIASCQGEVRTTRDLGKLMLTEGFVKPERLDGAEDHWRFFLKMLTSLSCEGVTGDVLMVTTMPEWVDALPIWIKDVMDSCVGLEFSRPESRLFLKTISSSSLNSGFLGSQHVPMLSLMGPTQIVEIGLDTEKENKIKNLAMILMILTEDETGSFPSKVNQILLNHIVHLDSNGLVVIIADNTEAVKSLTGIMVDEVAYADSGIPPKHFFFRNKQSL